MKRHLFSILALLLMAAGGAVAQTESVTITGTTTTGTNVTVTADEFGSGGAWLDYDEDHKVVVATNDGSNIEQLVLTVGAMDQNAGYVQASPGTCTVNGGGSSITVTGINAPSVTLSISTSFIQFTVVEVTFAATAPSAEPTLSMRQFTRTSSGSWVLDSMPDFDGQLVVTFYEQFRLDSIPLAWTIMVNGADSSAGVTAYTEGDTTKGWLNILEGSFVELIPPTVVKPKVKNVTLTDNTAPTGPVWNTVDLSTLTGNYEAQDHDLLTGTLGQSVKITIADGATVTLDGVTIATADGNSYYEVEETGEDVDMYPWSGITCEGDATIILTGENTVKGFREYYPGIYVPSGKTLIITGTGSLTASSNGWGTGIGGGYIMACGNIEIKGGVITATGGRGSAGIGSGNMASCGTITISGGTVTATGGGQAAGIGSGGYNSNCGDITITTGVTKVTATKGTDASHSIGAGYLSSCSTVTIGGVTGAISTSPYTYPAQ